MNQSSKFEIDKFFIQRGTGLGFFQNGILKDQSGAPRFLIQRKFPFTTLIIDAEYPNQLILKIQPEKAFSLKFYNYEYSIYGIENQSIGKIIKKGFLKFYWDFCDESGKVIGKVDPSPWNAEKISSDLFLRNKKITGFYMEGKNPEDHYKIDLNCDPDRKLDRRIAIALAAVSWYEIKDPPPMWI